MLSGKGGTGKTSLVASFAELADEELALCDCDVDAANLALLLPGVDADEEPFFAGLRARVDEEQCSTCGNCVEVCRYNALTMEEGEFPQVDDLACEGCRACSLVCFDDALSYEEHRAGTLFVRETQFGPLVHAELGIAEDNSGKLVTRVRERTRLLAEQRKMGMILIDGPPGIGCPVHASLSGASLVIAVTEPSQSGIHDLERLLDLSVHFKLRTIIVVNKFDLNGDLTLAFEEIAEARGASVAGGIPFHHGVPRELARGRSPLAIPSVRRAIEQIWQSVKNA